MSLTSVSRVAVQQPALIDVYSPFDGARSAASPTCRCRADLLVRARQGVHESAALASLRAQHPGAGGPADRARCSRFAGLIVDEAGKTLRQPRRR